jgi:hypothetical protein
MSLMQVYEKYFGEKSASAEKKADEAVVKTEEVKAEPAAEEVKAEATMTDADLDKALEGMSDEELANLAKEVAVDVKESKKNEKSDEEKLAEEYFAAGRIFGQGFLAETKGAEKTAAPAEKKATAVDKFAALLDKELKAK